MSDDKQCPSPKNCKMDLQRISHVEKRWNSRTKRWLDTEDVLRICVISPGSSNNIPGIGGGGGVCSPLVENNSSRPHTWQRAAEVNHVNYTTQYPNVIYHLTVQLLYLRGMSPVKHHVGESRVSKLVHPILCQPLYRLCTTAYSNSKYESWFHSDVCLIRLGIESCLNSKYPYQNADSGIEIGRTYRI